MSCARDSDSTTQPHSGHNVILACCTCNAQLSVCLTDWLRSNAAFVTLDIKIFGKLVALDCCYCTPRPSVSTFGIESLHLIAHFRYLPRSLLSRVTFLRLIPVFFLCPASRCNTPSHDGAVRCIILTKGHTARFQACI